MHELYWRDVEVMIEELRQSGDDTSSWTVQDENIAMLVDRIDFLVNLEYADKTTDPNDPEVKRRLQQNKRNNVKPAPFPIYPPVAARPQEVFDLAQARYEALLEQYGSPGRGEPGVKQSRDGGALSGWLAQMDATQAEFAEQQRMQR